MIHHISISARDPRRVASVIAELMGGVSVPFPAFPGAYIALPGDEHGTAIEVGPLGLELLPGTGDEEVQGRVNESASPYTATHAALSVSIGEERVKQIAAREGWRAGTFERGGAFSVVEVWVENRLLLEVLPPEMAARYLDATRPENMAALFAAPAEAGPLREAA